MFDCVKSIQFVIIVVCVRVKASVCKCVYEDIVMHVIFKWDVFEFIYHEIMNNVFFWLVAPRLVRVY